MYLESAIYTYKRFIFLVLLALITSLNVNGQENISRIGTQINDFSASNNSRLDFSILELNSKEKGFLMPRMTTAQRQNIPSVALQNGLIIYNTSIDCIEFFNQSRNRWLNLCGELDPANIIIQDSKCDQIQVLGYYFEGVFLEPRANIILLEINASTAGTYHIEANAFNNGTPNGYSFQASGVFPEPGNYTIVLRGSGTPLNGYDRGIDGQPLSNGDEIRFILNGELSSCVVYNFVEKESLRFKIESIDAQGEFFTGVDLQDPRSGALVATIKDITMGGEVKIYTFDTNGMVFSGSHILSPSEISASTSQVILTGQGTPLVPLVSELDFYTNSYVRKENSEPIEIFPSSVVVELVSVAFNCDSLDNPITHQGDFVYNQPLNDSNIITVPVKVLAPGKGQIKGVIAANGTGFGFQSEEIEFSSGIIDFSFNDQTDDIQLVTITPVIGTGKPTVAGNDLVMKISMESTGAFEYGSTYPVTDILVTGCDYIITTDALPLIYQINQIKLNSTFESVTQVGAPPYITPRTSMGEQGSDDFKLDVTITPSAPGEYHIKTDLVNGVYFEGSGIIEDIDVTNGTKIVSLKAFGESGLDLPSSEALYTLTTNSEQQNNDVETINVDFVYRPMTMYSLGTGTGLGWHIGGIMGSLYSGGPGVVRQAAHFSWNGMVRIDKIDIIGISNFYGNGAVTNYLQFSSSTNTNFNLFTESLAKADMVFLGTHTYSITDRVKTALVNYIKNNGVVFLADGTQANMTYFMNELSQNSTGVSYLNSTQTIRNQAARVVDTLSEQNQLLLGSSDRAFGKAYRTLNGLLLGSHNSTSYEVNNLPEDFETIAYRSNSTEAITNMVFSFVHKNYGFVSIGNGDAMGGFTTTAAISQNRNDYPTSSNSSTGAPIPTPFTGGQVWNSLFLLNSVNWAIDFAQKNQPNVVK